MSYLAVMGGREYEANLTMDDDVVELYWQGGEPPILGFELEGPNFYVRLTPRVDLDYLFDSEWYCEYKGEPFKVQTDYGNELSLHYLGGNINKAQELGLSIEEPLVAVGVVPRKDVENLREVRTQLWPPTDEGN
ncbi:hypothetical protein [Kutzneria sp. CA-103260]|uniref:hypothetical protein n=1 Tax=Kutzneria sp. CA-103260 TaxID=2802641 RepID=UPI001BAA94D6|nr:hypothetical protein [Kutzneria sp. CA-103260]